MMDTDNTRGGPASDAGTGTDSFAVSASIAPNPPLKRRPSGRVDFAGGVTLVPGENPIHVRGLGFVSEAMAGQLASSIAGALVELARQREREVNVRTNMAEVARRDHPR